MAEGGRKSTSCSVESLTTSSTSVSLSSFSKSCFSLPPGTTRLFESLNLWDICALIAASRGAVGSSLHGRIVALAHGLPRVSLVPPQQADRPLKTTAFAETWEPDSVPRGVTVDEIERAVIQALAVPAAVLRDNAAHLRECYRHSQAQWTSLLAV